MCDPKLFEILSERGLAVLVESFECFLCRPVILSKMLDHLGRAKRENEIDIASDHLDIGDNAFEPCANGLGITPENR